MGEYNLGTFIRRSRKALGLTLEGLCFDEEGNQYFSEKTLSRVERGKQRPNYHTIQQIMGRLGKEAYFYVPTLRTMDYRVLELNREIKKLIVRYEYEKAEIILKQIEEKLSCDYATNRQYLIRTQALIDQKLGRISLEEELELLEIALKLTVHSYGTENFHYEVLTSEEVVNVCNIASCYGKLGNKERALELLQMVIDMLEDKELENNKYPRGMREMVDANYICWIGAQGKYQEAIKECNRAISYCIKQNTLNALAGIYYMKALYQKKLWKENSELSLQKKERIELDYIICALLAEMIEDEKGLKLALSQLEELENLD